MASFSVFLLVLLSLQPIFHPSIRVCASSASDLFDAWSASHGKRYSSNEERADRLKIFEDNLAFITLHNNNLHKISNTSESPGYTLALNHFADMTHDEFKNSMLGLRVSGISPSFSGSDRSGRMMEERKGVDDGAKAVAELPDSVDWRNEGAVTNVKNQGSCGACWSFSATGAIEGINKIVTGSLVSLSEQELVDCDTSYNSGCEGGIMDYAFQFVIDNHGIDTEEDYPYEAKQKRCNKEKADRHIVTIDGYKDIPPRNENELLRAVASQPVSVGICGSERAFQFYSEGIFTGPCSTSLDHAVLIVGYGSMQGIDYWIVKNTWGTSWGKKGYIYMARNRNGDSDGMCGINLLASYPVKTSPNPPPPPRPGPKKCNLFTSCSEGETCCCSSYILGFCWSYKCCPLDSAVCCKDGVHCCPWDYPICDRETNKCLKNGGNVTAFTLLHGRESFFKKISDGLRRRSPLTDIFY